MVTMKVRAFKHLSPTQSVVLVDVNNERKNAKAARCIHNGVTFVRLGGSLH